MTGVFAVSATGRDVETVHGFAKAQARLAALACERAVKSADVADMADAGMYFDIAALVVNEWVESAPFAVHPDTWTAYGPDHAAVEFKITRKG